MTEPHVYSDGGVEWSRVFTACNAAIDTKFDPMCAKSFAEKSRNKNYKAGDLIAEAAAASEKRVKLIGKDPIKEKFYENYSKIRKGRKHPDQLK